MINILILDDEPHILETLPVIFEKHFKEKTVDTAFSFPKALELLESKKYDIALLDGGLSERMTTPPEYGLGFNLIPFVQANNPDAVIIMISTSKTYTKIGMEMGAKYAFSKNAFYENGKIVNSLKVDSDNSFSVEEGL